MNSVIEKVGKRSVSEPHYFSNRLLHKLERMRVSPAAVVEAPSGYGKTTAVRDYLANSLPQSAEVLWFTAVDEAPVAGYRRLCREIERIDSRAGERLLKIDFPNGYTLGETCDALRFLECKRDVFLVIDNFQFLCASLPTAFLAALLDHGGASLHIVVVTQMLGREILSAIAGLGFLHITAADLRLDAGDICRYYALTGLNLTKQDAERVFGYTDGWMIAVYLQLCSYRETGAFSDAAILSLMEKLIWNRLSTDQQRLLMYMSPFETVTGRLICGLLGCDALPDYATEALSSPLIRYDPVLRRYEPHSILFELMAQKRTERGEAFERECMMRAGDLCRDEGRTAEALAFYARSKNYGRMLSLNLSPIIFEEIGGAPFFRFALDIAQNCPADIRRAHPLSMLHVAWAVKASGRDDVFAALMDELDQTLPSDRLLRAEWMLLSCYLHFPYLDRITAVLHQAEPLFEGACSLVILPEAPWCFGNYCQLAEFHTRVGEADRESDELEAFIAIYSRVTGGHGSGADALFRAEVAYYRGDMAQAEIFAYKAAYQAEIKQQSIIELGAARILAEISLPKADTSGWQQAIGTMKRIASRSIQNTLIIRSVLDTVRGILLTELQYQAHIADWLKKGEFANRGLTASVTSNALTVYALYLTLEGDSARLIGAAQAVPSEFNEKIVFSGLLANLFIAVGYVLMGDRAQAAVFLERAAEKGMPDGLILPFVTASWILQGLSEELIERKYPQLTDRFNAIKESYGIGWDALHTAMDQGDLTSELTSREREIAILAVEGLHNNEIAQRLFIAESTVRAHLRTIFQKLDIDRRAKLAEKLK